MCDNASKSDTACIDFGFALPNMECCGTHATCTPDDIPDLRQLHAHAQKSLASLCSNQQTQTSDYELRRHLLYEGAGFSECLSHF